MSLFPAGFFWGAATSAHQVEGNNHNDWSEWEKKRLIKHGEQSGLATGHYQRYKEDLALAKELGHNAHRFSIEWSRIMPKPGVIDEHEIAHYKDVVAECRRLNIEPFVTLWHFTSPIWIDQLGGWQSRATVNHFGQYVTAITQALGQDVTYWITVNEANVYSSLSYLMGYWPPCKSNPIAAWFVIRNLLAAHKLASQIIHRANPHAKVGTANNLADFGPVRAGNVLDQMLVLFARYWHNQWWLDATQDTVDFIGLNYYFHHPLKFRLSNWRNFFVPHHPEDRPITDVGWPIAPDGMNRLFRWLRSYDRPIIVTENGLADADDKLRSRFIIDHVKEIEVALTDGIDIRGYLHWSLTDNFEWREGFEPRFGLIAIDYHSLARHPRPSAMIYRKSSSRMGWMVLPDRVSSRLVRRPCAWLFCRCYP